MKLTRNSRIFLISAGIVFFIVFCLGIWLYNAAYKVYDGPEPVKVTIAPNSTEEAICDSLKARLGEYGESVYRLWSLRGGNPAKATGVYLVSPGDRAWSVASRIKAGVSTTVDITFNNVRLMDELAEKIASQFPWSKTDFINTCDSVLPTFGFTKEQFPAAFLPDTYQFYASASPSEVVRNLVQHRNNFWNNQRRAKAKEMGLTPVQVATVASIVEEESNNSDERPTIARLYLNRLNNNMKLQADPTVKYALGDFTIKRLYEKHTLTPSPYNTYYVKGLPPGPIRIPESATLDAVLNCPPNDYLYMCAKPGGEGTHNFAVDYETHKANARKYQEWLNSKNIK